MLNNTKDFWLNSWKNHLDTYLKANPRTGIFIKVLLGDSINNALEIACGSGRDSRYLAKHGYEIVASDFEENTIDYLKKNLTYSNLSYHVADAFDLPFEDDYFDLVFHNGFFIYFKENKDIFKLLREQERVSKRYILILVHNILNINMTDQFRSLSKSDKLYDIRFFEPTELTDIIKKSNIKYKNISILKFGGPYDCLYGKRLFRFIPNILYPIRNNIIPLLYKKQNWAQTERIACLVEISK